MSFPTLKAKCRTCEKVFATRDRGGLERLCKLHLRTSHPEGKGRWDDRVDLEYQLTTWQLENIDKSVMEGSTGRTKAKDLAMFILRDTKE
jgi:hypothetical protein